MLEYLTIDHLTTKTITYLFTRIKNDPKTGCWVWQTSRYKSGYGKIIIQDKKYRAHRFMYAWLVAPLPMAKTTRGDTLVLDHYECSTPLCVNPCHLCLVTQKENVLRSNSPSAINKAKTHCIAGHEFNEKNTHFAHGQRYCRTCRRIRERERQRRIRESNYLAVYGTAIC